MKKAPTILECQFVKEQPKAIEIIGPTMMAEGANDEIWSAQYNAAYEDGLDAARAWVRAKIATNYVSQAEMKILIN